jgi:HK97 family phage major capsid protein
MKIKKADGSIVEVDDDYTPEEGEEIVDEDKEAEKEDEGDGDEEDEKAVKEDLKKFIKDETIANLDKELDAKSEELVKKFFDGVAKQRKAAIDGRKAPVKKTSEQELTRKWWNCLVNQDISGARAIQKDYLREGDDASGGYLVPPPALMAEINRFTEQYGVARREMRYLPFSGPANSRKIPRLGSSVSVYWASEAGKKSKTKPSFELVTQTLKKIVAIAIYTEELVEDSAIDINALLGELFGEAVAKEEDRVFFAGNTDDGDVYNGILNATGIVPVVMGDGDVAADIGVDDLIDMKYAVPKEVRQTGKFYGNSAIFKLCEKLKDKNDRYILHDAQNGNAPTLCGRPYEELDILPDDDLVTEETPFLIYTNLKKTCVYGDKGTLRLKLLSEATLDFDDSDESPNNINLAENDMQALRIVKRTGYVPVLPSGIAVLKTGGES